MKLDNDLVRLMLLQVEEDTDINSSCDLKVYCEKRFPDHETPIVRYHMKYLVDAGFVQTSGDQIFLRDITPMGRDFLNNVRNDAIWAQAKEAIKSRVGSAAIDIVSKTAVSIIMKALNLP